ncbi:MAG: hypothetical protein RLY31_1144 [Bacteroidota bacterium]|jgi:chemotaxis protein MotB
MKKFHPVLQPTLLLATVLSSNLLLDSCVSKKLHQTELAVRDSVAQQLNGRVLELNREIAGLKLDLAERKGENNVLRDLQTKQDTHIERLKTEIEKLTDQSLSQQQLLDMRLQSKQEALDQADDFIRQVRTAIHEQEQALASIATELSDAVTDFDSTRFYVLLREDAAVFGISEALLFKPGNTTLLKTAAPLLEKVAEVLSRHPAVSLLVKAHTDNLPVKGNAYVDNWDLTAQRAAVITKVLTREFYLNPSQLLAAGKGEFEPVASNESPEGRAQNRRIELVLVPKTSRILRMVKDE